MSASKACVLRTLDFENERVQQQNLDWLPPRVQCRYGYTVGPDELVWELKWWVYPPLLLVPSSIVLIGALVRMTRHRTPGVSAPAVERAITAVVLHCCRMQLLTPSDGLHGTDVVSTSPCPSHLAAGLRRR